MNCALSKRMWASVCVIFGFIILVNFFAYVQLTFLLKVPFALTYHIIPSVLGLIFGLILVYSHHAHCKAQESLVFEKMAKTDRLTGAMSRYAFEMLFENEERRFERNKVPYSVIMFDIDDFKAINDAHGHLVGDDVLITLCSQVKTVLRGSDILCRWGGEEFVLLLPETDIDDAAEVARRIHECIAAGDFEKAGRVTVSIGVVAASEELYRMKPMIFDADAGLYQAKRGGKNRTVIRRRDDPLEYVI